MSLVESLENPQFWLSMLEIIWINIILSGDNAVVIALACRGLPHKYQTPGMILGAGAAVVLRIIFVIFIVYLLEVPYLKIVGGLLLFWIAIQLLLPEEEGEGKIEAKSNLWGAVQTIVIADAVMSLDNVIGIAAAANGDMLLIVFGLVISVPLIVFGAALIMKLLEKYPIFVTLGGAILGYVAGEVLVTDRGVAQWVEHHMPVLETVVPIAGAVFVVVVGKLLARRIAAKRVVAVDLLEEK